MYHIVIRVNNDTEYPDESTLDADSFVVPDFIVSTSASVIVHVTTNGTVVDVRKLLFVKRLYASCAKFCICIKLLRFYSPS